MKINIISDGTNVVSKINDIDINSCDNDTILEALSIVLERLSESAYKDPKWYLNDLLERYIEPIYYVWDDEPCDQCGDNVCTTEWEL